MSQTPAPAVPFLNILWVMFFTTPLLFCFVAWSQTKAVGGVNPTLDWILPGVAVVDAILALLVPNAILARAGAKLRATPGVPLGRPTDVQCAQAATPAWVLRFILLELISLVGLLHALTTGNSNAIIPYAAVSLFGMFLSRPTPDKIRSSLGF